MDKSREIPPNAAPKESVRQVMERVKTLGVDWHEAVSLAGVSRNIGYKLKAGSASVGSLRKVEDWLVREEAKRGIGPRDGSAKIDEWTKIGRDLMRVDPQRFERTLESLRMLTAAKIQEARAMALMLQPTPANDE